MRVGGDNRHDSEACLLQGKGVAEPKRIRRGNTVFFEGPVIPMPASQGKEDYPKDYDAKLTIAKKAPLGTRYWHVATSQGVTAARRFIVGDLLEVVEREIDGAPIPTAAKRQGTVHGRVLPR